MALRKPFTSSVRRLKLLAIVEHQVKIFVALTSMSSCSRRIPVAHPNKLHGPSCTLRGH